MVAKGFTQILNVDCHDTTSPTPASAPVKIRVVAANELGLPGFDLDVSQASVQAPLEDRCVFLRGVVCFQVRSLGVSNASMVWSQQVGCGICYS